MIELTDFHCRYKNVGILQPDGDGGDMPQRTSFFHVGRFKQAPWGNVEHIDHAQLFDGLLEVIYQGNGLIFRSPLQEHQTNVKDIPGDQFDPVVMTASLYGRQDIVRAMLKAHMERWFFYPNGNFQKMHSISHLLRSLNDWRLYPVIFAFDFLGIPVALLAAARAKKNQKADGNWWDMDNAVTRLRFAQLKFPTPASWLTRKIYVWLYPQIKVESTLAVTKDHLPLLAAIAHKHHPNHSNKAFTDLWSETVQSWY